MGMYLNPAQFTPQRVPLPQAPDYPPVPQPTGDAPTYQDPGPDPHDADPGSMALLNAGAGMIAGAQNGWAGIGQGIMAGANSYQKTRSDNRAADAYLNQQAREKYLDQRASYTQDRDYNLKANEAEFQRAHQTFNDAMTSANSAFGQNRDIADLGFRVADANVNAGQAAQRIGILGQQADTQASEAAEAVRSHKAQEIHQSDVDAETARKNAADEALRQSTIDMQRPFYAARGASTDALTDERHARATNYAMRVTDPAKYAQWQGVLKGALGDQATLDPHLENDVIGRAQELTTSQ